MSQDYFTPAEAVERLDAISEQFQRQEEEERWNRLGERRSSTYLYVIAEAGTQTPVKIGYGYDVRTRLFSLQCGNPRLLEVRAKWMFGTTRAARRAEELTHRRFAEARLLGEWFSVEAAAAQEFIWTSFMWRMEIPRPKQVGYNFRPVWDTSGGERGV